MSDAVQPFRRQPTRLHCPWDSPGKNTGQGCHFLLQCMKVKSESEVAQSCPTLCNPMNGSPPSSSAHGIFQARILEWGAIAFSVKLTILLYSPSYTLFKKHKNIKNNICIFHTSDFFKQYLIQIPNNPMNFAILS